MYAVAVGSLHVKFAAVSRASGTPARRYDCCIAGIASTALPDCSVSRSSLPENQSSASLSVAGLKSLIVLFSFQAHVTVTVRGVAMVDTTADWVASVALARSPTVAVIIARASSASGVNRLGSRWSVRCRRRAALRRSWRECPKSIIEWKRSAAVMGTPHVMRMVRSLRGRYSSGTVDAAFRCGRPNAPLPKFMQRSRGVHPAFMAAADAAQASAGSRTVNVAPPPGVGECVTSPPWLRAMIRDRARPMPWPPAALPE